MTLGGLALAVGVLVDNATVELENTHRNFGFDKPLRQAILDGASQIATSAFVSTLAICIVFVPVLFLTGPAASLFYPLALAVVFAILTSYLLSRTLVPTMVLYMLPSEVPLYADPELAARVGGPIWRFHFRFEHQFERLRSSYKSLLDRALAHRFVTLVLMLGFAAGSLALAPWLGEDFFPAVDAGQFRLHVRAPSGSRIEETERIFGQVEDVIREIVPENEREMILDNMGLTPWFTTRAYIDNGTVTDSDGEILVSLKPEHGPTADYVARLREELPKALPRLRLLFPAGRHHQPNPGLRPARPDQRAGGRRAAGRKTWPWPRRSAGRWPRSPASPTSTSTRSPTIRRSASTWTASWPRSWDSRSRASPAACWSRSAAPRR